MYRIRGVDGEDDATADALIELHRLTFFDTAPIPEFDHGHWWLAFHETRPVGFAGIIPSTYICNAGYFTRVGVLREHSGHRLQLRLMRALEVRARLRRMVLDRLRYDRQYVLRQQLYSCRLSAVLAAGAVGVAKYVILAEAHKMTARSLRDTHFNIRPVASGATGLFVVFGKLSSRLFQLRP